MLREIVAQTLHPLLIGTRQIHIRNLVEPNQVHTTLQALQQADDLPGMRRRVVKPRETDILKRATALMGEVVLLQQLNHLSDRHLALRRHQLLTLLWQGRVHRDSHMALTLVEEALQLTLDTHTAHRDATRTPGIAPILGEHLGSPQHLVEIIHRLALTHKHDVRQTLTLWQGIDLIQDVACRETALKTLLARLTEQTVHLTAHLARHTERGSLAIRDIDRLHELA